MIIPRVLSNSCRACSSSGGKFGLSGVYSRLVRCRPFCSINVSSVVDNRSGRGSHPEGSWNVFPSIRGCCSKNSANLRRLWCLWTSMVMSWRACFVAVLVGTKDSPLLRRLCCCLVSVKRLERFITVLSSSSGVPSWGYGPILKKISSVSTCSFLCCLSSGRCQEG